MCVCVSACVCVCLCVCLWVSVLSAAFIQACVRAKHEQIPLHLPLLTNKLPPSHAVCAIADQTIPNTGRHQCEWRGHQGCRGAHLRSPHQRTHQRYHVSCKRKTSNACACVRVCAHVCARVCECECECECVCVYVCVCGAVGSNKHRLCQHSLRLCCMAGSQLWWITRRS